MIQILYVIWMIVAAGIVMFVGGALLGTFVAGAFAAWEKFKHRKS